MHRYAETLGGLTDKKVIAAKDENLPKKADLIRKAEIAIGSRNEQIQKLKNEIKGFDKLSKSGNLEISAVDSRVAKARELLFDIFGTFQKLRSYSWVESEILSFQESLTNQLNDLEIDILKLLLQKASVLCLVAEQ